MNKKPQYIFKFGNKYLTKKYGGGGTIYVILERAYKNEE